MTWNQGHNWSIVLCFAAGRLAIGVGCVKTIVCSTGRTCKAELKFGGSRPCRSSSQILIALFSLVLLSGKFLKQILLGLLNVGCRVPQGLRTPSSVTLVVRFSAC